MTSIKLICPTTRKAVPTGFGETAADLEKNWNSLSAVQCPHCGKRHEFIVKDAFVEYVMSSPEIGRQTSEDTFLNS